MLNKGGNRNAQANGAKSKGRTTSSQSEAQTNGTTASSQTSNTTTTAAASSGSAGAAGSTTSGSASNTTQNHLVLDPFKLIPIQITLPPQGDAESRVLTIHLPGSAIQNNQLSQMLTATVIQSIMNLPPALASSVLQQHVNTTLQNNALAAQRQLDGAQDTSDEGSEISDADVDPDDDDDDKDDDEDLDAETGGAEEEPLNSEDDVTDEDATDLFETDNVIVCQYDKVSVCRCV